MQDPDLLMDYCVADVSRTPSFFFNGELCIDTSLVISNHFFTSSLSKPGEISFSTYSSCYNMYREGVSIFIFAYYSCDTNCFV